MLKSNKACRISSILSFINRFVNEDDKDWFENTLIEIIKEHIGESFERFVNGTEPYFCDFLRDAPEATGEEAEDADIDVPNIYEPVR